MSKRTDEYTIKCWNDCEMGGCPGHTVKIEANNTSNALLYTKDGEAKFGMDFDELEAFIKAVYEMRHWVEVERMFGDVKTATRTQVLTELAGALPEKYTKEQISTMIDCSVGKALVWNEALDTVAALIRELQEQA